MKHGPGEAYSQITKKWTKGTWLNNQKVEEESRKGGLQEVATGMGGLAKRGGI